MREDKYADSWEDFLAEGKEFAPWEPPPPPSLIEWGLLLLDRFRSRMKLKLRKAWLEFFYREITMTLDAGPFMRATTSKWVRTRDKGLDLHYRYKFSLGIFNDETSQTDWSEYEGDFSPRFDDKGYVVSFHAIADLPESITEFYIDNPDVFSYDNLFNEGRTDT